MLGPFKIGVGKLIAHSQLTPIVLPIYHRGMDNVIPEIQLTDKKSKKPANTQSIIPKCGQNIELFVGNPIDFTLKINNFKEKYPGSLDVWQSSTNTIKLYNEITEELRISMLKLESEAYNRK